MYTAIQVPFRKVRFRIPSPQAATTMMVNPTTDLKDLPQSMNPQQALQIINYLPTSDASLPTRKGIKKIFTVAGNHPITLLQQFTADVWIFGYEKTTAAYTVSTGIVTNIKTNWPTNDAQSGVRYGDYFFVCNGSDVIHRIDLALTITAVAGSPHAKILRAIGPRLYAGNLSTDATAVAYSYVDNGSNPPFTDFTVGTGADAGGLVNYRNAGDVTAIDSLGANVVVGARKGKWSFTTTTIDSGGTLVKDDQIVLQRIDMGMARTTIVIPKGLFYVNTGGIWQLSSIGQSNVPFSEQEGEASLILGVNYFTDIDLTNADFAYDAKLDTLFLTCARDSVENNLVIAYNLTSGTYAEFIGWKINRFMNIDQVIYGAGSQETTVWKCFSGFTDDGNNIWTTFYQELKLGGLETRQTLSQGYIDGFLSPSSELTVFFDIYNTIGNFVSNKLGFKWTADGSSQGSGNGYGTTSWGDAFGGDEDFGGLVECFAGYGPGYIRNFQRLRIKIEGHSNAPHVLIWVKVEAIPKVAIRRRNLVKIT